jgi:hypothetical protein
MASDPEGSLMEQGAAAFIERSESGEVLVPQSHGLKSECLISCI